MANIAKALKELEKVWESSDIIESQGFTPLSDGNYTGKLTGASVEMSQNGRVQIVWSLKVTEGKNAGKTVKKFDGVDNEISIGYAKGLMTLLGVSIPSSLAKLPSSFESFFTDNPNGVDIEFTVKTKDEFVNVYINSAAKEEKQKDKSSSDKEPVAKSKLKYSDLDDMDKEDLVELIKEKKLDIDDYEKIKEAKLRRYVAEELNIAIDVD